MDEEGLRSFLKRGGRSANAIKRCLRMTGEFEQYLHQHREGKRLDEAEPEDLESFVAWIEREPEASARTYLWALCYCFEFIESEELREIGCSTVSSGPALRASRPCQQRLPSR